MSDYQNNIITVKFARAEQPKFEECKGKGYIKFGEKDNYPEYLIDLYNESPKHGAIVKGKATYVYGKGFSDGNQKINKLGQTRNYVLKRAIHDDELFGGYYLQVVYNMLGKITDVYHIEYKKVRTNKERSMFFVKNDWSDNKEKPRQYKAFDGKYDKEFPARIVYVNQYNPKAEVYSLPNYLQGLNYIDSDVQVSRHILGNAKDGFVASTLINLNNGEPVNEQKEQVERGLKKKFTGSEGDRVVIMFNKSADNQANIQSLSNTMLTKEDFTNINNLISQEIFSCHQVTSPMLFGIKTEGQLGGRTEIQDAFEIFKNTYANERQQAHEEAFNYLFSFMGIPAQTIMPVEPIGFNLKEENLLKVLPVEYFYDKMGLDKKYWGLPPVEGQASPGVADASGAMQVNENLAGMTGRKFQQLQRIVRKYKKGDFTRKQAEMMLRSSFGMSDEDIATMLDEDSGAQKFASEEEMDFEMIEQFSQIGESKDGYDILEYKELRDHQYFKDVKELNELEANILSLIKKDGRTTPEAMAVVLKREVPVIEKALAKMEEAGVFTTKTTSQGEDQILVRTATDIDIRTPRPTITDIMLRYSYDWRQDISASERASGIANSRPFCVKMLELNRLYTRAEIELISERLGYSVFDRAGGWWTRENGEHSPKCRHTWYAVTVIKKS